MSNSKVIAKQIRLDLLGEFLSIAEARLDYLHERNATIIKQLDELPPEDREDDYRSDELVELSIKIGATHDLIGQLEKLL
jgi:hypothetical protein